MFGLGATELAIILVIVIVLFGARRLPEIGSGVGKAIKNFRAGMSGQDEIDVTPDSPKPDEVTKGSSDPALAGQPQALGEPQELPEQPQSSRERRQKTESS